MTDSRIAVVTGATAGIGWHTAAALAARGDHVVIVGRDAGRADAARERILAQTPAASVDIQLADFASLREVDTLATALTSTYPRIDVLVNNAGAFFSERATTVDGYERTWAVNHLAPFWLTTCLLPRLRASAPARIVTVSSAAHAAGRIDFADVHLSASFSGLRAYNQSKLANILFTYELAARLADSDVTANALHPGFVATDFGRGNPGVFMQINALLQRWFAISPVDGAATSILLATDPTLATTTGAYFSDRRQVASSRRSYDVTDRRKLWDLSVAQCRAALGQS